MQSGDEGIYECRAYRKDELIASSSVHVYAEGHLPQDVARIEIAAPTVRVVNKGDSIILDCVVSGWLTCLYIKIKYLTYLTP